MLSAREFTVGTLESTIPLSLLLPRHRHEAYVLVGQGDQGPVGVVLSGQFAFYRLETRGAENWKGLIVPNVQVEVDESSLFSPDHEGNPLGAVLRLDTQLVVSAKDDRFIGRAAFVSLYSDLVPTGGEKAGFHRWHVVVGQGSEKRALWQTPEANLQGA